MGALYDAVKKKAGTAPKGSLYERLRVKKSAVPQDTSVPSIFGVPSPYSTQMRTSTQAIPDATTPSTGKFVKEVAGYPLKVGLKAGLTLAPESVRERIGPINPREDLGDFAAGFLGDAPIEAAQKDIPVVEENLEGKGYPKPLAKAIAYTGITGDIALGLLPLVGSLEKKGVNMLSKLLSKVNDPQIVTEVLTKHGVEESLARDYGQIFARLTDENQIKKGLLSLEGIQRTTKPKVSLKDQFKVGDVLDPQGKTNMVGKVTIRDIKGNTLKFVDSEGTEFAGMARSTVRSLVEGGSWKHLKGEKTLPTPEGLPEIRPSVGKLAEDISTKATQYQGEFAKNVEGVAKNVGLDFEVGPPKTSERITEKAAQELGGDVSKVMDANRGVIFVDNLQNVGKTLKKVVAAARKQFGKVERVKLTIGTPSYNKVIVNVRTPAGVGEIQLTTPDLWKIKLNEGDILYSIARSAGTPKELSDLFSKRMEELYQGTPTGAFTKAAKGISEGGATMDVVRNIDYGGTPHIAVSPFPERSQIYIGETTRKMLAQYLRQNFDLLSKKGYALGGWFDTSSGQTYLDVVVPVPKNRSREAVALGRMSNQKAIFDLEEFKEIPTGGTGETVGAVSLEERTKMVNQILNGEPPKRPPSAEKILGKEPSPKVTRTEEQLLKSKLREQSKGAKAGFKAGKAEARIKIINELKAVTATTDAVRKDIVEFVKEALDPADRGKALVLVRDAETQRDLTKAFARVNRWAEEAEKKEIRNEILDLQKKIMDSPSIAIDYKAKVKELMGDFELKGHREDTLARLKATQDFIATEAAKGNDVEMPRRVLRALSILNKVPFEEITISQMQGLKAEMELLEQLGRTKFKTIENIYDIQKKKIFEEIELQKAETIENIELIRPEIGERLTMSQKFKNMIWSTGNLFSRIDKVISPMDTVFDLLDGGKGTYAGANYRFFKGQVDAGYGRYIGRRTALQTPVIELSTKYKLDDANFERMGVVAAREQDGGMQKLVASGFTEEEVNAVKLTPQEQEVLDKMRETFDSQFPEIRDTMRAVYNQPVEKVKNYFSFMTDWKAMDESEVFERFGSQAPEQFGTPRKNVEAGFTKSRVGGDQKIKVNALDVFLQHTDNTSYLLELGETSKMLGEVASSPRFAELVGTQGQLLVREWVDVVARKGGAAGASQIPILDTLRRNVGAGILGLKLSTVMIQPTSLLDGMGFIGAKYGTSGLTHFLTDSKWRKFVLNMPEIKDRMGGEFALRELTDDNWLQEIQRKGFIPLQVLDQMTAGAIAAGAYERKLIELGLPLNLDDVSKEALEYAQLAVRRTQSSGSFKDVPLAVSRGALTGNRSLDRAILQFQNFLLTRWSRIRHDAIRASINEKNPMKAVNVFFYIALAAMAASGMRLGVNKVQDFITGREDEDSVTEDLQKNLMFELTGNVPFLGTAMSMAMYDGEFFPILDAPKGVIEGLNRALTSKSEGAKLRGLTQFVGSTGTLFGIPGSTQAEQLVRGALQDEKKPPEAKKPKIPGLPELPSLKKALPTPPGLPALP